MNRKTMPWSVKQVVSMIGRRSITFDSPVQRPSGQWKDVDKSLLIHSLLTLFLPDIYAIQVPRVENDKTINTYDVIDGKQRLTIIDDFKANKFALTTLEPIKLESTGEEVDISGLTFSQLPEDVQDSINSYNLTFKVIEFEADDDADELIDTIFYRLNNGVQVSNEHQALVAAPKNIQNFVHEMVNNSSLYTNVAHFAAGSIKKSDREMSVMQSIIYVSGLDFKSFAAKDVEKFFVENQISDEVLQCVSSIFNDIATAYNNEHSKFITKINIPSFVGFVNNNEDNEKAVSFVRTYAETSKKGDLYRNTVDQVIPSLRTFEGVLVV